MQPSAERASADSPRLSASLRRFGATLAAVVHTRAELLAIEIQREKAHIAQTLVLGVAALFFLVLGAITLTIFIIVLFWDSQRLVVIGFLTVLYLALGIGAALFAKRAATLSARPFSATVAELKKDREFFSK